MSVVTGVVLTMSVCEQDLGDSPIPGVVAINAWLLENVVGELRDVTDHAGGGKHPQIYIYAGGFNHLDEEAFDVVIRSQNWEYPGSVGVVIQPEHGKSRAYTLDGPGVD